MHESAELRDQLLELVSLTAANGDRELPSLRDLATRYGVAPNTIKKTLLELDGDITVFAVHGRGFFLQLPGDPEPVTQVYDPPSEVDEPLPPPEHIEVDTRYSPVPEEGRALRKEYRSKRDSVVVVGQLGRATDPTGLPAIVFCNSSRSASISR